MPNDTDESKKNKEFISIIYNQKNDSPKYFELKKTKLLLFVIGLPTITLIALVLGVIGLVHTSPFHLIDTYRQNSLAREAIAKTNSLMSQIKKSEEEKAELTKKLAELGAQGTETVPATATPDDKTKISEPKASTKVAATSAHSTPLNCPAAPVCPALPTKAGAGGNSIGLSTLSFFHPIQGQRDRTRPATLNLSGFKIVINRDTVNLQFNIIPVIGGEEKLAGHIIAVMKNELAIQVYPPQALGGNDNQVNYSSGETFATQRFRPVDANFLKPRKAGNYIFTVYIFAKNGDLLHFQSVVLPVRF